MVFGLDFSGALLQLVEGRRQGQIACDIGLRDEGAGQTMAESGDLLHEVATMFTNVCQLDPQAGFCDEGPSRELPGAVLACLAFPVPGGGDPTGQILGRRKGTTPEPPHAGPPLGSWWVKRHSLSPRWLAGA